MQGSSGEDSTGTASRQGRDQTPSGPAQALGPGSSRVSPQDQAGHLKEAVLDPSVRKPAGLQGSPEIYIFAGSRGGAVGCGGSQGREWKQMGPYLGILAFCSSPGFILLSGELLEAREGPLPQSPGPGHLCLALPQGHISHPSLCLWGQPGTHSVFPLGAPWPHRGGNV